MRKLISLAALSITLFACGDDQMSWRTIQNKNQVERQGTVVGTRILELTIPLRIVASTDTPGEIISYEMLAYNPSSRVTMAVEIFFVPDDGEESIVDYAASAWVLRARAMAPKGSPVVLHEIPDEVAAALPRAYEVVSGVKILGIAASLDVPNGLPGPAAPGTWYVRGYWEPVVEISDEELVKIFNDCKIEVGGAFGIG